MGGVDLAGVCVKGVPHPAAQSVLTPEALNFVAQLARYSLVTLNPLYRGSSARAAVQRHANHLGQEAIPPAGTTSARQLVLMSMACVLPNAAPSLCAEQSFEIRAARHGLMPALKYFLISIVPHFSQRPAAIKLPCKFLLVPQLTLSRRMSLLRRRKHTAAVHELLARRRTVQARFDAGQKPHFLPQTRSVPPPPLPRPGRRAPVHRSTCVPANH